MRREDIVMRVLNCLDEVSEHSLINVNIDYPIDNFLDEAAFEVLCEIPDRFIDNLTDFSDAAHSCLSDRSGVVELPDGFIRLVKFKIKGWRREVLESCEVGSPKHIKQSYAVLRGGVERPVVVIDGAKLIYYVAPEGETAPEIESALAVTAIETGDAFPEVAISALAWLVASKTLMVMNEVTMAGNAMQQYNRQLQMLNSKND